MCFVVAFVCLFLLVLVHDVLLAVVLATRPVCIYVEVYKHSHQYLPASPPTFLLAPCIETPSAVSPNLPLTALIIIFFPFRVFAPL